jgi:hypothetical protein
MKRQTYLYAYVVTHNRSGNQAWYASLETWDKDRAEVKILSSAKGKFPGLSADNPNLEFNALTTAVSWVLQEAAKYPPANLRICSNNEAYITWLEKNFKPGFSEHQVRYLVCQGEEVTNASDQSKHKMARQAIHVALRVLYSYLATLAPNPEWRENTPLCLMPEWHEDAEASAPTETKTKRVVRSPKTLTKISDELRHQVKAYCKDAGITQRELSVRCGKKPNWLSHVMDTNNPSKLDELDIANLTEVISVSQVPEQPNEKEPAVATTLYPPGGDQVFYEFEVTGTYKAITRVAAPNLAKALEVFNDSVTRDTVELGEGRLVRVEEKRQ